MAQLDDLLFFNGVNGATGAYGLAPMNGEELARFLREEATPANITELRRRVPSEPRAHRDVREGVDPRRLEEAGWGVILTPNIDPAVREAIEPLVQLRREQAGELFRIYEGQAAYRRGESKSDFLARHGAGPGPADPSIVPYYLMIVGSPQTIPFNFQSQLAVQYAVGRIYFETAEEYANYAQTVVDAESGKLPGSRRISLFGAENPDDRATRLSVRHLVEPLAEHLCQEWQDWTIDIALREQATKANLGQLLGGARTPAVLFTAGHGVEFPQTDPRQLAHQGALLCQDWPGPKAWNRSLPEDHYFAANDLGENASLAGLISFHFACYGAGTPALDGSTRRAFEYREGSAPHPFLAALPMRLLSRPRGGALAVVGQAERAWGYSFLWPGAGAQTAVFESSLDRLRDGYPIGAATAPFHQRHAELSTMLADLLQEVEPGAHVKASEVAGLWVAQNDARSSTVLGDPAVRLPQVQSSKGLSPRPDPPEGMLDRSGALPLDIPGPSDPSGTSFGVGYEDLEEVHFSAYHPRVIGTGERHKLLAYAHLPGVIEAIATDAGRVLGMVAADYHQAGAASRTRIVGGTEIILVPEVAGLVFDPPEAHLHWSGNWQRADFTMEATGERVGDPIHGTIACYVGPLLIAEIPLPISILGDGAAPRIDQADREVQTSKMYQAIFASYSHADTAVVQAMEAAYTALGMDYLRDVMNLKSGQKWSDELFHMIERADIFQLFWSEESSRSPFVEHEWRHALHLTQQKGPGFIRPVYWRRPLPPVPPPLYHIHFSRIDLASWIGSMASVPQPTTAQLPQAKPTKSEPAYSAAIADRSLDRLTVSTFSARDPENPDSATLRAQTRISLTGDVEVFLPEDADSKDVLAVHEKTVREALRARLAYLDLLAGKTSE